MEPIPTLAKLRAGLFEAMTLLRECYPSINGHLNLMEGMETQNRLRFLKERVREFLRDNGGQQPVEG
jgi:hypothetical protein